jgi:proliferating cell nuclear antigen
MVDLSAVTFKEDYIYIKTTDDNHICLNVAKIKVVPKVYEKDIVIGISLVNLSKILKNTLGKLTIKIDETFTLNFEEENQNTEFELDLVDIEESDLELYNKEPSIKLELNSKKFKSYIDSIKSFGDVLQFCLKNSRLSVSSKGEKVKQKISFVPDEMIINDNKDLSISFAVKYLGIFTKATNISEYVNISLYHEEPIFIEYGTRDNYINFYLSPKIGT